MLCHILLSKLLQPIFFFIYVRKNDQYILQKVHFNNKFDVLHTVREKVFVQENFLKTVLFVKN